MSTFKYYTCLILGVLIIPYRVSHAGGSVRFRDGYSSADGRVEVKYGDDGTSEWGNICSDEFDIIEADVICRQMEYAWALDVYDVSDALGDKDVVLWDLECEGHESNVYDCEHRQTAPSGGCDGVRGVGVQCIPFDYTELDPIKRLRFAGDNERQGKLEIRDSGIWEPICSDGWDILDSVVACRQLGFISAVNYTIYSGPGYQTEIYKQFECHQHEGYLLACGHAKGDCYEYVALECICEFEDNPSGAGSEYYYEWTNGDPCDDFHCYNGGYCFIDEYFEAYCECPTSWEGEYCEISADGNGEGSTTDFPASTSDVNDHGGDSPNPAPTDPSSQTSSDDVIIYVAIGAGAFVLIIVVIVTIAVASMMRKQSVRRSTAAKTPVEMGLKGKQPATENKRNNNSYQPPLGLKKPPQPQLRPPPQGKPVAPSSDYYLEPSPDYTARTQFDDYTALASPGSEIYDEIPYDSIDNGGYMDLSPPADYQPPPQLPKPR